MIKKSTQILFGLFMVFIIKASFSQQYFPFPADSATWSENCASWEIYPWPHHEHYTSRYFINGDTIIDSTAYSKLYVYFGATEEVDTASSALMGGIREDSIKQILFYPMPLDHLCYHCDIFPIWEEFVLYKFGAEIDDVVHLGASWNNLPDFRVEDIDSILVDSYYRKRYKMKPLAGYSPRQYWIEGIGSDMGLFGPSCQPFEGYMELLCYEDPETYYNPSEDGCFLWTFVSVDETGYQISAQISPVPATDKLHVTFGNRIPGTSLVLLNARGQMMNEQQIKQNTRDYVFNVSGIEPGLYLVVLFDRGVVIDKKKVLVSK